MRFPTVCLTNCINIILRCPTISASAFWWAQVSQNVFPKTWEPEWDCMCYSEQAWARDNQCESDCTQIITVKLIFDLVWAIVSWSEPELAKVSQREPECVRVSQDECANEPQKSLTLTPPGGRMPWKQIRPQQSSPPFHSLSVFSLLIFEE